MYCLDTNILVDILRGDNELAIKVNKELNNFNVYITSITLCELFRGAFAHSDSHKKILEVKNFVSNFELLGLDEDSCEEFGRMFFELKKSGKTAKEFDVIIASIVKSNDLVFVTRDKKHFEKVGIKVESW